MIFSLPVWVLFLNHFSGNWGQYVFLSWMPTNLKEELNFNLSASGFYSLLPFILMGITNIVAGWLSDFINNRHYIQKTISRKLFHIAATAVPATSLIVLGSLQFSAMQVITLFCLSIGFLGFAGGSSDVNFLDLTRHHTGTLFGMSNTIATIPGIVGVYFVGYVLDNTSNGWNIIFFLSAGIFMATLIFWLVFATADNVLDDLNDNEEEALIHD